MEAAGWSSLPVPSVQNLAASLDSTSHIPARYVRDEAEADPVTDDADIELPIIDLQRAMLYMEESSKIGLACEEWGFFQLINHGVPGELIEKMKVDVAEFFKLPLEEKEAFARSPSGQQGYGQIFVVSEEQKLEWGDALEIFTKPDSMINMNFWPTYPPTFRDTLDKYTAKVEEVANSLLRMIGDNLGLDPEIMTNKFKDMRQAVRINYYPPCPKAEKVLGLSPHSDATGITILLQASTDVHGLQIKKNGNWFPVKPLPGSFIVNVGDILEIFSNGKYKSVEHRAVVNTMKERLSMATFHAPPFESIVSPLPEITKGGVGKYKASSLKDYMMAYFSTKLDGKSHLENMKLGNEEE